MYENIPLELRQRLQWVCAGPDKIPLNPRTGQPASVTDPGSWATFEEACRSGMKHIGFVLTEQDPYCIIDLDNKIEKPITPEEWAVHERILTDFESYTERSASGRGYHVVIQGQLAQGRRRGSVEIYSAQRYMIFTGDVVRNLPITNHQARLNGLVAEMPAATNAAKLEQVDTEVDDAELHAMALGAINGTKYDELCKGDWKAMGYPSQSEADFALLSILSFYSRDNEQVRRLFRMSALGKRDKAYRDDRYLNTALSKIRATQPKVADYEAIAATAAALRPAPPAPPKPGIPPPPSPGVAPAPPVAAPATPRSAYPPGLVGAMAQYFFNTAQRPVQDIAISAAIGLFAGIMGRCFNISNTGLNQYLLVLANTGVGKEGGSDGIEKLLASVRPNVPMVDEFIGPGAFASGQALIRVLDQRPSFLCVLGEFGHTLEMLNDPRASAPVVMLKRVLLDLYSKSGWAQTLRGTAYSDQEKNTKSVHAPNVSILGDTTPQKFYDNISLTDIADGLIPRLQIIECRAERPDRNLKAGAPPSKELSKAFADAVALSLTMQNNRTCANVQIDTQAAKLLDGFDHECDEHLRSAANDGEKQLWNRAHLKSLKLAALLAVGVNQQQPVVTTELAEWAIAYTRTNTTQVLSRFETGDFGTGDGKQLNELKRIVRQFFSYNAKQLASYKCSKVQQEAGVVPYAYLVVRAASISAFSKDPRGATRCLKQTLETAVQSEFMSQVPQADALKRWGIRQALYYPEPGWLRGTLG